jgi:hypothetical protein
VEWKYQSETVAVETERTVVRGVFPVGSRDSVPVPAVESEDRTAGSKTAVAVAPVDHTGEHTAVHTVEEAVVAAERRTAAALPVVPAGKPVVLSSHKGFLPTEHTPAAVVEHRLTEEPSAPVVGTLAAGIEPVERIGTVGSETEPVPSVAA